MKFDKITGMLLGENVARGSAQLYRQLMAQDGFPEVELKNVPPKTLDQVSKARTLLSASMEDSFLYSILLQLKPYYYYGKGDKRQTLAVDAFNNLYMCIEFIETLTLLELVFVLAHEACHHGYLSTFRLGSKDPHWWNIATDVIINRDLKMNMNRVKARYDAAVKNYDSIKSRDPNARIGTSSAIYALPKTGLYPETVGDKEIMKFVDENDKLWFEIDVTSNRMDAETLYLAIMKKLAGLPGANPPKLFQSQQKAPPGAKSADQNIRIGDLVYNNVAKQYGQVTAIDETTKKVSIEPRTEKEVKEMLGV